MSKGRLVCRVAGTVTALAAMAIMVGGCGGGGTHVDAAGPAATAETPSAAGNKPATPVAPTLPATTQVPPTTAAPTSPAHPKARTVAAAPTTLAPATTVAAPALTAAVPTAPALPARTQPSAAQVKQVIASVHALFPLFSPTPAQIAQVGNEVCTAFDQGKTVAQVKTEAMQVAGVYAALIPPTVVNTAVRTIVTLYCPGYTSSLA